MPLQLMQFRCGRTYASFDKQGGLPHIAFRFQLSSPAISRVLVVLGARVLSSFEPFGAYPEC